MNEYYSYITGGSSGDKDFAIRAYLNNAGADIALAQELLVVIDAPDQIATYDGLDSAGSASFSATGIQHKNVNNVFLFLKVVSLVLIRCDKYYWDAVSAA